MSQRVSFTGPHPARVDVGEWQTRVDELRQRMLADGHDPATCADDLRSAFGDITFHDDADSTWRHDGGSWWHWDGAAWAPATPPPELRIARVEFDVDDDRDDDDGAPDADSPPYRATHVVPDPGLPTWSEPDPALASDHHLEAGLDVMVTEQRDDGWANIACSNGWTAWVDGRLLHPVFADG